jgi:hypothetical protein
VALLARDHHIGCWLPSAEVKGDDDLALLSQLAGRHEAETTVH